MIIAIASGKGGTGKTTVAVSLALSLDRAQYVDCDVEEPNGHLFLKPSITARKDGVLLIPQIDETKCNWCGVCQKACSYHALAVIAQDKTARGTVLFFPHLCHGCGACTYLCPRGAIREIPKPIGIIESGESGTVHFVHGKLNVGEVMSPPLIRQVKKEIVPDLPVILDAPPGTSCPVIAALKGSDSCILVTEPTPFGLNDLRLAVEVVRTLGMPFGVISNRSDCGDDKTERYCQEEKIPVLMNIPFRRAIAVAYSRGESLIAAVPAYRDAFRSLYDEIVRNLS